MGTVDDEVTQARRVRLDDISNGQELSTNQRRTLAKGLPLGQNSEPKFYTEALTEFRRTNPELAAA